MIADPALKEAIMNGSGLHLKIVEIPAADAWKAFSIN